MAVLRDPDLDAIESQRTDGSGMKSDCYKNPAFRSFRLLAGIVALLLVAPPTQAQTFTVLHTFTGAANDGNNPQTGLTKDREGNLYGAALGGAFGSGIVFEVSNTGVEKVLYSFKGYPDGEVPDSISFRDRAGSLLGTTYQGGPSGYGTVFKLDTQGEETIVYSFCPNTPCTKGTFPGGVISDDHGNLYGVTFAGGDFSCELTGCGVVFGIDNKDAQTVLHAFAGAGDGETPNGPMVRDASGNLYGATTFGGAYGYGTVFEVTASGEESVKYSFDGAADGSEPYGGLYLDREGSLYGTTSQGGAYGYGTVFEVSAVGNYMVVYSFRGGADGATPYAAVIKDREGNLFGSTYQGGLHNYGTIFKIDVSGKETLLHSFSGEGDGAYPSAVTGGANGNLYGTAYQGGAYNYGTVFQLVP